MNATRRNWLIVGVVLVTLAVLALGTAVIAWVFFAPALGLRQGPQTWPGPAGSPFADSYDSNGEQIYWTGTSRTGPPITADMDDGRMMGPWGMQGGMMACVTCHGPNGEGGTARMMMDTYTAPNIQWEYLTEAGHGDEHAEHEPYTEETFKHAVTEGIEPSGEQLEWPMPRWDMTDAQLEDLIAYLKTLE